MAAGDLGEKAGETPSHLGHRARLRARLLERGGEALADHELSLIHI